MTSLRKKILEGSTLTRKKRFKDVMTFHSEKKNKKGQTYILFFFLGWPPHPSFRWLENKSVKIDEKSYDKNSLLWFDLKLVKNFQKISSLEIRI